MAPYREYRPPAGLESMVACLWEREPAEERRQRVVPDGCVDSDLAGRARADDRRRRHRPARGHLAGGEPHLRDPPASRRGGRAAGLSRVRAPRPPGRRRKRSGASRSKGSSRRWPMRPPRDASPCSPTRWRSAASSRIASWWPPSAASRPPAAGSRTSRRTWATASASSTAAILAAVGYGPKMLVRVARLRRLIALEAAPRWRRARSRPGTRARRT